MLLQSFNQRIPLENNKFLPGFKIQILYLHHICCSFTIYSAVFMLLADGLSVLLLSNVAPRKVAFASVFLFKVDFFFVRPIVFIFVLSCQRIAKPLTFSLMNVRACFFFFLFLYLFFVFVFVFVFVVVYVSIYYLLLLLLFNNTLL
jgi:hypothetical protein